MSNPANAYIDARNELHAAIEPELSEVRTRYRNNPSMRHAMVSLICMRRREFRLLLWSYHNASEPNRIILRNDGDTTLEMS